MKPAFNLAWTRHRRRCFKRQPTYSGISWLGRRTGSWLRRLWRGGALCGRDSTNAKLLLFIDPDKYWKNNGYRLKFCEAEDRRKTSGHAGGALWAAWGSRSPHCRGQSLPAGLGSSWIIRLDH